MKSNKKGVLITGGDFQGLGVLRTFGEKNIPIVLTDNEPCIAKYSKYKKKFFKSPDPFHEDAYVDFLLQLAEKEDLNGWVIFPNNDKIACVLSKNKTILEEAYKIPVPNWDVMEVVYSKEKTYKLALQHDIPIPKTFYATNVEEMAEKALPYPVIVKPSIKDNFYSKVKVKAYLIKNRDELVDCFKKVSSIIGSEETLVQEFIPGGTKNLYSFCPFFKDGRSETAIMARRIRQHPMDFGHATTFAEVVDIPQMRAIADKFLSLIGYYGLAEVEFMRDPRDDSYKLIEVNPRIWGWHSLAIFAGVDLPYILYKDMLNEKIETPKIQRDVKWMRITTDFPTVVLEILKRRMTVSEYMKTMTGGIRDAVFSLRDPVPFIAEVLMVPYFWYKRGF